MKKITDEELLDIVETGLSTNLHQTAPEILRFMETFNIKEGEHRVPIKGLYQLFKQWSPKSIRPKVFARYFSDMIPILNTAVRINMTAKDVLLIRESLKPVKQNVATNTHKKNHFESYLRKYNLKRGTFFIRFTVLYDLYDKWLFTLNKKTMYNLTKLQMREFLKLYFNVKQDKDTTYYGVDHNILNILTHEQKLQCLSSKGKINAQKKENNKKISS